MQSRSLVSVNRKSFFGRLFAIPLRILGVLGGIAHACTVCLLADWHRPLRDKVKWTGLHFAGSCKYCGARIYRKPTGRWRRAGKRRDQI